MTNREIGAAKAVVDETTNVVGTQDEVMDLGENVVVKNGVLALVKFIGYDIFEKKEPNKDTGEIERTVCFSFLKYESDLNNGLVSKSEIVTAWIKNKNYDYLFNAQVLDLCGVSLSIQSGTKGTFTRVLKILSKQKTEALKLVMLGD